MQQTIQEDFSLNKWMPFRLLIFLLVIFTIGGTVGITLDNLAIKDQEKIFNEQQALQARVAATALEDRLNNITEMSQTLKEYPIKEFLKGHRSSESLKELFKIKQNEINSVIFISLHTTPANEIIFPEINTPELKQAKNMSLQWVEKYFSTLSGMRSGFITPRPIISSKSRLAGMLVPVWFDNRFAGVMTMIIDLGQLTDKYINPLKIGEYGSGFIIDGSGTVVFDQEKEIMGKNVFALHKDFPTLIKQDSRMLHEESGHGEYSFYAKRGAHTARKLLAWNTVRLGELKLVIAISAPDTDATKALTSIRAARIAMIVFMALAMFAVIFFFYHYRSKQLLISQNNELKRKDLLFDTLAKHVPGVIYKCEMSPPYVMHYISPKVLKLTGVEQEDFMKGGKTHYLDQVHPQDREQLNNTINEAINKMKPFSQEYRINHSNGSQRWVYEEGTKLPDENSIVGYILDITERKKEEHTLESIKDKYRAIVTNAPLGIFQSTPEGTFVSANPQMALYYGYTQPEHLIDDITNISNQCYTSSDTRKRLLTILKEFGRASNFEAEHLRRDGSTFWASETVTAISDEDGNVIRYDGFLADISERKEHEETMRRLAMYDSLTGLPNRVLFDDRMKQALSRAHRSHLKVAVLYADLDNFKPVNDELGHIAGDAVLRDIAGRFSDCLRTSDTVSRIGGDEFIFILQDIGSRTEIEVVANRIIDSMRAPFYLGENVYRLGVSIGISLYPDSGTEKEDLVRLADDAMYKAKSSGKNCFSY